MVFCLLNLAAVNLAAMESRIQTISYDDPKDRRILKACLSRWFENPKDLNLTDPRTTFPFNFQQWVRLSYGKRETTTLVSLDQDWIVGHISITLQNENTRGHIFHLIVDRNYRRMGTASQLIRAAEGFGRKKGIHHFTLRVTRKNLIGQELYLKFGYKSTGLSTSGSLVMEKVEDG